MCAWVVQGVRNRDRHAAEARAVRLHRAHRASHHPGLPIGASAGPTGPATSRRSCTTSERLVGMGSGGAARGGRNRTLRRYLRAPGPPTEPKSAAPKLRRPQPGPAATAHRRVATPGRTRRDWQTAQEAPAEGPRGLKRSRQPAACSPAEPMVTPHSRSASRGVKRSTSAWGPAHSVCRTASVSASLGNRPGKQIPGGENGNRRVHLTATGRRATLKLPP